MIDDVTTHATLTSYSLTVMCHLKKKCKRERFYCWEVESTRNSKLWRLSGRFQTLIWRPGDTVQNLPDYPGDSSPAIGCIRFARYCDKMYSRHSSPYHGLCSIQVWVFKAVL